MSGTDEDFSSSDDDQVAVVCTGDVVYVQDAHSGRQLANENDYAIFRDTKGDWGGEKSIFRLASMRSYSVPPRQSGHDYQDGGQ